MCEYYLRISVQESEIKLQQYHWFAVYDKDRKSDDVLQWMLSLVIKHYNLTASEVLIEQFSKM